MNTFCQLWLSVCCKTKSQNKSFFEKENIFFKKIYTIYRKKIFLHERKNLCRKKTITEKRQKFFQKKKYVNNISFEKYIFMQKIYVLQRKRYYYFNYIIRDFCKRFRFDHKNIFVKNSWQTLIIWSFKLRKHAISGIS